MAAGEYVGALPAGKTSRDELVKEFEKRYRGPSKECCLALRILRNEAVDVEDFEGESRPKIFKCVTKEEFPTIVTEFSAMQLAALSANRVALDVLGGIHKGLLTRPLGILGNTPAHFAALAGDVTLMEELQGDSPKENKVKALPSDIVKLLSVEEEPPYHDIQITSKDLLQLWMAGMGTEAVNGNTVAGEEAEKVLTKERVLSSVEVKSVSGVGKGLFSKKSFKKGEPVCFYGGAFSYEAGMYPLPADKRAGLTTVFGESDPKVDRTYHLSGVDGKDAIAGKVNDGSPNVVYISTVKKGYPYPRIVLVALKDIRKGEQLLVDYGLAHPVRFKNYESLNYAAVKAQFLDTDSWSIAFITHLISTPALILELFKDETIDSGTLASNLRTLEPMFNVQKALIGTRSYDAYEDVFPVLEKFSIALQFAVSNCAPGEHGMRTIVARFIENAINYMDRFGGVSDYREKFPVVGALVSGLVREMSREIFRQLTASGRISMGAITRALAGKTLHVSKTRDPDGRYSMDASFDRGAEELHLTSIPLEFIFYV